MFDVTNKSYRMLSSVVRSYWSRIKCGQGSLGLQLEVTVWRPNEIWSFDFVNDYVLTDRRLKVLTIVDDCGDWKSIGRILKPFKASDVLAIIRAQNAFLLRKLEPARDLGYKQDFLRTENPPSPKVA